MAGAFLTVIMAFTLLPSEYLQRMQMPELLKSVTKHMTALQKQLQRLVQMLQQLN